jgi:hypothetical protein
VTCGIGTPIMPGMVGNVVAVVWPLLVIVPATAPGVLELGELELLETGVTPLELAPVVGLEEDADAPDAAPPDNSAQ